VRCESIQLAQDDVIVLNVVMKLKDSIKGKEHVAQLSNSQLPSLCSTELVSTTVSNIITLDCHYG